MSPIPKKYIHDRVVLLLLSVGAFLAVLGSILVLLRVGGGRADGYIVQYRANLGISAFKTGSSRELFAFIGFLVLVLVINTIISARIYYDHRQYALTILGMGILLQVIAIIVSNALLIYR